MMHFQYQLLNPFGPNILKAKCPQFILDKVNKFIDGPESRSVSPDLLDRDIDVVYLTEEFCESIQLKTFVEELGQFYNEQFPSGIDKLCLSLVPSNDDRFDGKTIMADAWVNRYRSGDFTPVHIHAAELSGIILLEVPEDPSELCFMHGHYLPWTSAEWVPKQEVGDVILFPSWLQHMVFPQKHDNERRTLSFNLIDEQNYSERKWIFSKTS